jgi:hypothetical protein
VEADLRARMGRIESDYPGTTSTATPWMKSGMDPYELLPT